MTLDTFLRRALMLGVFLVPFIPFMVAGSMFFPFITFKNFFFRILVEVLFASWAILAIRNAEDRPRHSLLLWAVGIFTAIVALADVFGISPAKSIWSNFERMEGLMTILHLALYFLILPVALRTEKIWSWFLHTTVGASVFMGFYGLLQLSGALVINQGGVRLDGTLGNATYLAIYMVFHFFFTALLAVRHRGARWVYAVYGAIMLLQLYILYYTATRGAIIGLLGGSLIAAIAVALFEKERRVIRKAAIGAVAAVVLIVGGFLAVKDATFVRESPVLSRFATISPTQATTQSRFLIWNMAYQGFQERPILGWGQEGFNYVFNKYYDPQMWRQEPWFDRVHNMYLDWLIAAGALGFLAYLSLYVLAFWYLLRLKEVSIAERAVLGGLLIAYGVHNLFVFDNLVSHFLFFTVLAYIHARTVSSRPRIAPLVSPEREFRFRPFRNAAFPVIAVVLIGVIYIVNAKGILASRTLLQSVAPQQGGLIVNLENFKRALSYESFGQQEVREQLLQAAFQINTLQEADVTLKRQFIELAMSEVNKQIEETPDDARPYVFVGTFLNQIGQYQVALPYLEKAAELSPAKQTTLFELGTAYIKLGDTTKGLALLERAFTSAPENDAARLAYAAGLIYAGNQSAADALLAERYGTTIVENEALLKAYFETKRYDRVIAIWQERVRRAPGDAGNHVGLAASYLAAGERQKAIDELQAAIDLDAAFKQQGEFLISEIRAGRNP